MKSYWSILCEGAQAGIVLKKFERILGVKAITPEIERIIFNDKKMEVVDFFVEHSSVDDWCSLVITVLEFARKLSPRWLISMGNKSLVALYEPEKTHEISKISGLYSVKWELADNQIYERVKWLGKNIAANSL